MALTFKVEGTPIPQGSKKAFRVGDGINLVEANKGLKTWREAIHWKAMSLNEWNIPFTGPIAIDYVFIMPRPKRPKFDSPATKPDLDKLIRAVNDSLKGLIVDDSRIVGIYAEKRFETEHATPGVIITINNA